MLLVIVGGAATYVGVTDGLGFLSARVLPRTIAGGIALAILGFVELTGVARSLRRTLTRAGEDPPTHRGHTDHHCHMGHHDRPRLWPLLLPFMLLPAALLSSTGSIAGNKPFVVSQGPDTAPTTIEDAVDEALAPDPESFTENGVTEFTMETFADLSAIAFGDPEFVQGRRVRLTGFVYRQEGWPETDFVVGRLSIWCCLADAALVGLLARGTEVAPEQDRWVEIEGVLAVANDYPLASENLESAPIVIIDSLRYVEAPEMEYVLPGGF